MKLTGYLIYSGEYVENVSIIYPPSPNVKIDNVVFDAIFHHSILHNIYPWIHPLSFWSRLTTLKLVTLSSLLKSEPVTAYFQKGTAGLY